MAKKIVGILVVGLLIITVLPVGSTCLDEKIDTMNMKPASQIEIKIKNGLGVTAIIKNIGTTDINHVNVSVVLDGPNIFWGKEKFGGKMSLEAGCINILKSFILGFGSTNINITIDEFSQTASAKVIGFLVYNVK